MPQNYVGSPLPRREDPALLTGRARYTDDHAAPGMAHAAFVRSQYGHARVEAVDTTAAEAMAGVLAVRTGADYVASGAAGELAKPMFVENGVQTDLPIVATDRVRFVGEIIAVVVAEDRYTAHEAADAVSVSYDRLDAVVDPKAALADDAPTVHDHAPDNVAYDWTFGDEAAVEAAFADADHVTELSLRNQRLIGNPMEPRATLAEPDGDGVSITLASQSPYRDKPAFAEVLGLPEDDVRVIAPAVGGGFGIKGGPYPDEVLTAWAALQLDRPVKWAATRTEGHAADNQSRDWYLDGAVATDADGTIRGLRLDALNTVGAYNVFGPTLSRNFEALIAGQYEVPAVFGHMRAPFTNTAPVAPYRGAGRPEVIYFLERLVDTAARELAVDPVELRRRNQIPADAFPYETVLGKVYDSGDYERALDLALETVDYDGWRERQAAARDDGRHLGIGVACFVENTGTGPGLGETGRVRLNDDGTVTAFLGTHDHGQGHSTSFGQVLADELGIDLDDVEIVEGDTADLPDGTGTFGSRSAALGGSAVVEAAGEVLDRATAVAADQLETSAADIAFEDGRFHVVGAPDRSLTLAEVVQAAGDEVDLDAIASYDPPNYGWAFGTHVAVVAVDPDSGELAIEDYVAVDDCGTVINPLIVEGQIHGGIAQGLGQALYEHAVYDDSGTLVTGSFQDYAMPRAAHVPEMTTDHTVTPSPHNPLGVKGSGESGTIAATPAVANAVVDALAPFGVRDVELPITPETVWRAVRDAEG